MRDEVVSITKTIMSEGYTISCIDSDRRYINLIKIIIFHIFYMERGAGIRNTPTPMIAYVDRCGRLMQYDSREPVRYVEFIIEKLIKYNLNNMVNLDHTSVAIREILTVGGCKYNNTAYSNDSIYKRGNIEYNIIYLTEGATAVAKFCIKLYGERATTFSEYDEVYANVKFLVENECKLKGVIL